MKEHNDLLEQTMPKKEAPVVEVEAAEVPVEVPVEVHVEVPVVAPVSRRKRR